MQNTRLYTSSISLFITFWGLLQKNDAASPAIPQPWAAEYRGKSCWLQTTLLIPSQSHTKLLCLKPPAAAPALPEGASVLLEETWEERRAGTVVTQCLCSRWQAALLSISWWVRRRWPQSFPKQENNMKIQNSTPSHPLIWEWKNKLKLPLLFKVILNSGSPWYNMEMIVLSWFGHCAQSQLTASEKNQPCAIRTAAGSGIPYEQTQSSWTAPWAMLAVTGSKCTLVRVRGISTAGSFPPEINKNSKAAAFMEKYASSFGTGGEMGQSPIQKERKTQMEKITGWCNSPSSVPIYYFFTELECQSLLGLSSFCLLKDLNSSLKPNSVSQLAQSPFKSMLGCSWMWHLCLLFHIRSLQHWLTLGNAVHSGCTPLRLLDRSCTCTFPHWCLQLISIITATCAPSPSLWFRTRKIKGEGHLSAEDSRTTNFRYIQLTLPLRGAAPNHNTHKVTFTIQGIQQNPWINTGLSNRWITAEIRLCTHQLLVLENRQLSTHPWGCDTHNEASQHTATEELTSRVYITRNSSACTSDMPLLRHQQHMVVFPHRHISLNKNTMENSALEKQL